MRHSDMSASPKRHPIKTAILVMPFGLISFPDIGVSSIKAFFRQHGYTVDIKYCNIDFARRIGIKEYLFYVNLGGSSYLFSEYPFATDLNPEAPAYSDFLRNIFPPDYSKRLGSMRSQYHDMLLYMDRIASKVKDYLDDIEANLDLSDYDVIGFTSSFAQNSASWACARRLRRRYPNATIVMGGANCEGAMAQAQVDAFDFIDYACSGEGEISFLELVKWLEDPHNHPFPRKGIVSRKQRASSDPSPLLELQVNRPGATSPQEASKTPGYVDLATLPTPDYDDYFHALEQHSDWRRWYYGLPLESSRGCWWGEKVHCVFCGLNGEQMTFRQKSAEKFAADIHHICARYGEKAKYIQVVDNIMPYTYFNEFLPLMVEKRPYDVMFYEIKSNLKREQIKQLRDAGITFLQPGIESLSTPVLKIMRKGVTAIANIQTLKFATEYGVWLVWSILCGFPGELPEHYTAMADIMPKIYHLTPPRGIGEITIDRHSPLHQFSEQFGLTIEPAVAYKHLYSLPDHILNDLAYWFEDTQRKKQRLLYFQLPDYAKSCQRRAQIWKNSYRLKTVRFDYEMRGEELHIVDSRSGDEQEVVLSGIKKTIVEAAMSITSLPDIQTAVRHSWPAADNDTTREAVEALIQASYLFQEGKQYLFLGLSRAALAARPRHDFWLEKIMRDEDYTFT